MYMPRRYPENWYVSTGGSRNGRTFTSVSAGQKGMRRRWNVLSSFGTTKATQTDTRMFCKKIRPPGKGRTFRSTVS